MKFQGTQAEAEAAFKEELDAFREEVDRASQFYYSWHAMRETVRDKQVLSAMNENALFWLTASGGLHTGFIIALGRLFDPDSANHNVARVLQFAARDLTIFSKEALADRKRTMSPNAEEWLPQYLKDVYEPKADDIRRLRRHVQTRRELYQKKYMHIRHQTIAHLSPLGRKNPGSLYADTTVRELQQMIVFLRRLHKSLWELFYNGRKPVLRPARFSVAQMLQYPLIHEKSASLPERIARETERVLKTLATKNLK